MGAQLYYILPSYFSGHPTLQEIIDLSTPEKRSTRPYLALQVIINNHMWLIPLRSHLKFDRIGGIHTGFRVPGNGKRGKAGLDFQKALLISNIDYLQKPKGQGIPSRQFNLIERNLETITKRFDKYIYLYKNELSRGKDPKDTGAFRFSTLINFEDFL